MYKILIIIWISIIPQFVLCQESFFLDSLFLIDLSNIENVQYQTQSSEIKRLQHDWGLSAGVNITNSYQEEIDAGLSTRVYARANLLSGGFYDNSKSAEILSNQIRIDSIQGIKRAIDHNYGIYFDYIIYLYNKEKLKIIENIVTESSEMKSYYQNLYYNKLISYDDVLALENTIDQYSMLKQAQKSYNKIFAQVATASMLPLIDTQIEWEVDFEAICDAINQDSSMNDVLLLKTEMIDIESIKDKTPSLSIAAGYDMSRHRPYFGVNFYTRISTHKNQNIEAKKLELNNDHDLNLLQKKKEMINLQYEFRYKEKQVRGMYLKLLSLDEEIRKYKVRCHVLSLSENIQLRKIKLQRMLINYEIIDLFQQQMLQLLKIKKTMYHIPIGPFIKEKNTSPKYNKYNGNRFVLLDPTEVLSTFDQYFLSQNEIRILTPFELAQLNNVVIIEPEMYDTRADMEVSITQRYTQENATVFLIQDLESLKQLELRTLAQKDFDLTSLEIE